MYKYTHRIYAIFPSLIILLSCLIKASILNSLLKSLVIVGNINIIDFKQLPVYFPGGPVIKTSCSIAGELVTYLVRVK